MGDAKHTMSGRKETGVVSNVEIGDEKNQKDYYDQSSTTISSGEWTTSTSATTRTSSGLQVAI